MSPSASVLQLAYDIQAKLPNVYDMEKVESLLCIYSLQLLILLSFVYVIYWVVLKVSHGFN